MGVVLGMAALAIDLTALFVARNEAQRAADAAALAGARELGKWGGPLCNSGLLEPIPQAVARDLAKQAAAAIGNENLIGGRPASIAPSDVIIDFRIGMLFGFAEKKNPTVRVVVRRTGTQADPMTFFARYWGIWGAVSAEATAEVYANPALVLPPLPSPARPLVGTICVKPWLLPDRGFIHSSSGALRSNRIGEPVSIMPNASYPSAPPQGLLPFRVVALSGETSADAYRSAILGCHPKPLFCRQGVTLNNTVESDVGILANFTEDTVNNLIQGHDTLDTSTLPFRVKEGGSGKFIGSSDSIVTLPLYDEGGAGFTIVGFLQIFVESVDNTGKISGRVLGATGCIYHGGLPYRLDPKSLISDGTRMCPGVEARLVQQ
jgi:hypothetical protein